MVEQEEYPYVKGSHGIPFSVLKETGGKEVIISGSGKILLCTASSDLLEVSDFDDKNLYLQAHLSTDGLLTMALRTHSAVNPEEKHPDMFASRFIELIFRYFANRGREIECFLAQWGTNSDNYSQFMDVFQRSNDKVLAAKSTWSGEIIAKHGLTEIRPEDILVSEIGGSHITALFGRTKTT